jgi:hypothetical protein
VVTLAIIRLPVQETYAPPPFYLQLRGWHIDNSKGSAKPPPRNEANCTPGTKTRQIALLAVFQSRDRQAACEPGLCLAMGPILHQTRQLGKSAAKHQIPHFATRSETSRIELRGQEPVSPAHQKTT